MTTDTAEPIASAVSELPAARLERLLREHVRPLERIAASYGRSSSEREDLLQDIAVAVWSALPGFRGECSERTFLLRIAHNRALSFLSKRGISAERIEDHEESAEASSGKNPALTYERKERGSQLLAATRALPLPHRQVMLLLLEGLSQREVASVLGISDNNVAVRANRARAALRVLLGEQKAEQS